MLQLGDSFYAAVFRSGSSVAHRLLTSHSKQGISNSGMEAKAEETLKPSEAGLREGTPTDIPLAKVISKEHGLTDPECKKCAAHCESGCFQLIRS
jgi:hypothetical protein